ncbi:chymotrypsin-1-like [Apis laboriosa]|uniref:chymotrypsin-1-like n=1 Tax=Apis laboriosa TaxID=183418 RepID=UPI001CC82408|nr:chymotrypsin-1-like [Apis laboriosa]
MMFYHVLVTVLIIDFVASGFVTPRIVGGHDAADGEYSYQVSIRLNNYHICGGSIIDYYTILTAAHCIYQKNASEITIVVGTNYLSSGTIYVVKEMIWHENYNEIMIINDIGLIRVKNYIKYNKKVQPISLASNYTPENTTAVITGWGQLNKIKSIIPYELQVLNVTIISREKCEYVYNRSMKNNICTLNKEIEGVCMGDSGSPLVVNGKEVGIVSFGIPCAMGFPDVYTSVFSYESWIKEKIKNWNVAFQINPNIWIVLLMFIISMMISRYSYESYN